MVSMYQRIYKDKVRGLGVFRQKNKRLSMVKRNPIAASSYLKQGYEEDEVILVL